MGHRPLEGYVGGGLGNHRDGYGISQTAHGRVREQVRESCHDVGLANFGAHVQLHEVLELQRKRMERNDTDIEKRNARKLCMPHLEDEDSVSR